MFQVVFEILKRHLRIEVRVRGYIKVGGTAVYKSGGYGVYKSGGYGVYKSGQNRPLQLCSCCRNVQPWTFFNVLVNIWLFHILTASKLIFSFLEDTLRREPTLKFWKKWLENIFSVSASFFIIHVDFYLLSSQWECAFAILRRKTRT